MATHPAVRGDFIRGGRWLCCVRMETRDSRVAGGHGSNPVLWRDEPQRCSAAMASYLLLLIIGHPIFWQQVKVGCFPANRPVDCILPREVVDLDELHARV